MLAALDGHVFRSMTTHGLHLERQLPELVAARPDKVHISIHHPGRTREVERVMRQVGVLEAHGVPAGINLLVRRSGLQDAAGAVAGLDAQGLARDCLVLLPMRGSDTPSARQVARVAAGRPFQSMTCLTACRASPRFASVGWDQHAAWCSYTRSRAALQSLDYDGLLGALDGLGLDSCGVAGLRA